jgi:uncharacterized protein YdaT
MITQSKRKEIMKALGYGEEDNMKVSFFKHKSPDMENATILKAKEKANMEAQTKSEIVGAAQVPDYSIPNLIRLGAKQSYKEELYIKIVRRGAKDWRSMKATQEHKDLYSAEYEKYLKENKDENIKTSHNQGINIQSDTSGFYNDPQTIGRPATSKGSLGIGEFSYTINC